MVSCKIPWCPIVVLTNPYTVGIKNVVFRTVNGMNEKPVKYGSTVMSFTLDQA